jgi:hypothetical protein
MSPLFTSGGGGIPSGAFEFGDSEEVEELAKGQIRDRKGRSAEDFCFQEKREQVLALFARHLNLHPSILYARALKQRSVTSR